MNPDQQNTQDNVQPTQPAPAPENQPPQQPLIQPAPIATPQQPAPVNGAAQQTDTLGLVSVILAFVGFQLIGLILGIIGMSKAKKEGYDGKLSKIGTILNAVFMVLATIVLIFIMLISFRAAQEAAEEASLNSAESSTGFTENQEAQQQDEVFGIENTEYSWETIAAQLESYYNSFGYYPEDIRRSVDVGTAYNNYSSQELDAFIQGSQGKLIYEPMGCNATRCEGFTLSYAFERDLGVIESANR